MLTLQTLIDKDYPVHKPIDQETKDELIKENEDKNYSYQCLLKEVLSHDHITPSDLLRGYSGVKLFNLT